MSRIMDRDADMKIAIETLLKDQEPVRATALKILTWDEIKRHLDPHLERREADVKNREKIDWLVVEIGHWCVIHFGDSSDGYALVQLALDSASFFPLLSYGLVLAPVDCATLQSLVNQFDHKRLGTKRSDTYGVSAWCYTDTVQSDGKPDISLWRMIRLFSAEPEELQI